ncbi:VOC family protein [Mumia zhuanghuii]|uniref:VOC family protein n=2 Tax=Mumia TaxID=1546255 RepID=A0ABW1QJT0_9ACTN|nr:MULTISPECIES: VOC family protein [Mumia]KAA1418158.1 VOC family protein [Mumia zhuanghuii]
MSLAELKMITLDCADAPASAAFWSEVLGWEVAHSQDEYAMLTGPAHALGFGSIPDYEAPAWPNEHGSKQFHLDLAVDDLETAEKAMVNLGARVPDEQPGETWRVLIDPGGHPFCITRAGSW